jgi:succinate dehydrogenase/fumarate reductase cytochrome b subunit
MKKITKTLLKITGVGTAFVLSISTASAALENPVIGEELGKKASQGSDSANEAFASYFISLWNAIIAIGAILVLVFFMWGAVEWIASGGDKGKLESARNRITQAIIGLVILVGSYVLLGFISQIFFGESFDILSPNIPNVLE